MRPRIIETREVNNGLFTSLVTCQKVTTSGSREHIERYIRKRANQTRRMAQIAVA